MAGRHAKPISLHLQNGNKRHLTKAEIEHRQNSEVRLGTKKMKCPDFVKNDVDAFKKWKELIKLYEDVEFVSSGDIGMLARYCITHSQYLRLLERLKRIKDIAQEPDDIEDYIYDSEEFDARIRRQLMDMVSTDGVLRIEKAVNQKLDILIKMEDRLFLNPVAKVKNIPKKESEGESDPNADMFG
jgi:phage terminase small subunit